MSKNIQMPYEFLLSVERLIMHLECFDLDAETITLCNDVNSFIDAKIEQMEKRNLYTKSKTAETPEAREAARLKYLDKAGIKQSFRY